MARRTPLPLAAVAALAVALVLTSRAGGGPDVRARLAVTEALGGADTAGYRRAMAPRPFSFPEDHGPHPGFRTEWWYFTGNLEAEDGRAFGYQLTFFRNTLTPDAPERTSAWGTGVVWMAHFAVTDAAGERFRHFERFAREAVGLAGASGPEAPTPGAPTPGAGPAVEPEGGPARRWRVWVEDWTAGPAVDPPETPLAAAGRRPPRADAPAAPESGADGHAVDTADGRAADTADGRAADTADGRATDTVDTSAEDIFPIRLRAAEADVALDLVLARGKPPVLQGDRGLSRKGPEPGNASYYYSLTRMPTAGTVRIDGRTFRVRGASWLDREWSTSALGADMEGWDWFALQLSDGRELMYYRLRRRGGAPSPFSAGTLVDADGGARPLSGEDVMLRVLREWRSPADGTRYPAGWRLAVPSAGLDLAVEPVVADQELRDTFVRYWEGAARVRGTAGGEPVRGRGYVELTGYGPAGGARE